MLTLGLFAACSTPSRSLPLPRPGPLPGVDGRVLTTLDLLAAGEEATRRFVEQLDPTTRDRLAASRARAEGATVRVAVRHGFHGLGSYGQNAGSGVLVTARDGSPLVLSAAHTFATTADDRVTHLATPAGDRVAATMTECVYEDGLDYAVLRPTEPVDACVPVRASALAAGELVLALGYPDVCGMLPDGRIARSDHQMAEPLAPLSLLLRVVDGDPLQLLPVAGALPLDGFSGGGLFDLDGRAIGVLTGVEWSPGADALEVAIKACGVLAMQLP